MGKLIKKADIVNRNFISKLYHDNSVDTGESFRYSFPYELAKELFGEESADFLYEVSEGLNVTYCTEFNGIKYVSVTGFHLMRAYRGAVLYREMREKWIKENEVLEHDTSTRKQHGKQCVSNKAKQV